MKLLREDLIDSRGRAYLKVIADIDELYRGAGELQTFPADWVHWKLIWQEVTFTESIMSTTSLNLKQSQCSEILPNGSSIPLELIILQNTFFNNTIIIKNKGSAKVQFFILIKGPVNIGINSSLKFWNNNDLFFMNVNYNKNW